MNQQVSKIETVPFWLLATVTSTATAALHIFVPVLPFLCTTFSVDTRTAQLALTLYLIGLAVGQLAYGPLADRFGRRPTLITSQMIYLAGLLLGAVAPTIHVLLVARVIQALGACGALVIGRAMVRDLFTGHDATRKLATLGLIMTMTPALMPAVGGAITEFLNWRMVLITLAAIVALCAATVIRRVPETLISAVPLPRPWALFGTYVHLWSMPVYRRFTITGACAATSLYGFLASAPFLLCDTLHMPLSSVGLFCFVPVVSMMGGTFVARQRVHKVSCLNAARNGNMMCLVAAIALLGICASHHLSIVSLLACLVCYAGGVGIVSPNALAGLMNADPGRAGAASSLYGFLQMACGAGFTVLVSQRFGAPGLSVACSLLVAAVTGGFSLSLMTVAERRERMIVSAATKP